MFRSQTDEQLAGKPQSRFRPPVNPILVAFRDDVADGETGDDDSWLTVYLTTSFDEWEFDPTEQQIDHARKVLTRLGAIL